jgi:hypothetical protein
MRVEGVATQVANDDPIGQLPKQSVQRFVSLGNTVVSFDLWPNGVGCNTCSTDGCGHFLADIGTAVFFYMHGGARCG